MSSRPLVLVLGAARSGKSRWALGRAGEIDAERVFLATAEPRDPEMADRIDRHRRERGPGWRTIEEPRHVAAVLRREAGQTIVLDCLTFWLANVMGDDPEADVGAAVDDLLDALVARRKAVVAVSNEVGWGIVPERPLARAFRDAAGIMNQRVAGLADEVVLLVAGQPLRVK